MRIKHVIGVCMGIVLFLTAFSAIAQDTEFQTGQLVTELKEQLNLTEDQITELRPLMKEHSQKLRDLVEEYRGKGIVGLRSLKEDMQQLRDETKTLLDPILHEEQKETLKTFYDDLREKVHEKVRDRIISGLTTRVNMTAEQAQQVLPILKDHFANQRALVEKYQEQGRKAFRDFRNEHQQLQKETEERLQEILTAEQLQEFKAFQEELKEKIRQEIFTRRAQ
jgi:cyanate lyase